MNVNHVLLLITIAFAAAEGRTAFRFFRAGQTYKSALIRCGDLMLDRNPLDPKTLADDLKQAMGLFRPHVDSDVEHARLRTLNAFKTWFLLMFLWVVSSAAVLLIASLI